MDHIENTNQNTEQETQTEAHGSPTSSKADSQDENRWVARFEELLKVKNLEDLKGELHKIAEDVQSEIQRFDLNAHLSPSAKARLKRLEQRYAEVMKLVAKAQKQFDREFNKSLRVLKKTRQDAEKQMRDIRTKITKHRGTIIKASQNLTSRFQGRKPGSSVVKKVRRSAKKA